MPLPDELKQLAKRVSNWGRWGDDDQRGTLNFITPQAVRRGVAAVRRGVTFSLSIPYDENGPQTGVIPGRINPKHTMIMANAPFTGDPSDFTTSDDLVEMGVQAATHWDGLAHVGYEGLLYNDTPDSVVTQDAGAAELGIEHYGPIVTRGVLLDIARLKGVEYFDDNYAIGGDDLAAAEQQAGVTVESGTCCWCAPARWSGCAAATGNGSVIPARVSASAPSSTCTTSRSPPWPPTRSCSRCGRPKTQLRCCPST